MRLVDVDLELTWSQPRLGALARTLFSDAPVGGSGGKRFDLRCCGQRFQLHTSTGVAPLRQDLGGLFQDAEVALTEAALDELRHRFLPVHAAVVARRGAGVLIIGEHDAGKTSLACALAQAGATLLSDEVGPVDPATLTVAPFPRDVIIHSGKQNALTSLPPSPGFKCFAGYRYLPPSRVARLGHPEASCSVPVRGLLFPRRTDSARSALCEQSPAESARRLLQQSFDLAGLGGAQVLNCVQRLAQLPTAQVTFHSADQVVGQVETWWEQQL